MYVLLAIGILLFTSGSVFAKTKHSVRKHSRYYASSTSHAYATSVIYGAPQLASEINQLVSENSGTANIAVYVKSMQYGDTVYTRNISQSMVPASTMKILTAEAALIYLGADYRFPTQLLTDAKEVRSGVLRGNLYVVLSGDPTLTYPDLLELMMTLRNHGISAVAGNVYIDNTAYDQSFYGPGWIGKDKSYCYAAPISASIINHNCLSFQVAPAKLSGAPARVVTSSKYFTPAIKNNVVTKSSRVRSCSLRLSSSPNSIISVDGCLSKSQFSSGVSYVVTDVPEYNRQLFKSVLSRMSISVYGSVTFASAPEGLSIVGTHTSEPLPVLITEMLKKSDNVIAGALFKKLGQTYTRQPGSWQNGSLAVSQILSQRAGVNIAGMRILDGSGLSPNNLATPTQLMQVLEYAYHHDPINDEFISALPISGVDGTLKHRMANIIRRVRAKTGTISGVVSLAGYVTSSNKEPLAFVIMVNGSKGLGWRYKSMEDKIATALTRYLRA